jgi:hypothetical protein
MAFHMPDDWYDPPPECECKDECTCAERELDARDDYLIDHPRERET